jgi:SAM-dependent methyltransferase
MGNRLEWRRARDPVMEREIGGDFVALGIVEREMLIHYGLEKRHSVVDVGCGAGRLAIPLAEWLEGPYLGTDIVAERVRYARKRVARPDWRFEVIDGCRIPAKSGSTDFVCFFSVFTHLLHECSYLYLEEAKRVLRPGGKIVFSFLEFKIPAHWKVFAATAARVGKKSRDPLNVFLSRDAIAAWAAHLGLAIEDLRDGDEAFVPLPHPVTTDSGKVMEKLGYLGQSVCVLVKPTADVRH